MSAGAPFPHCGAAHGASGGPRAGPEVLAHPGPRACRREKIARQEILYLEMRDTWRGRKLRSQYTDRLTPLRSRLSRSRRIAKSDTRHAPKLLNTRSVRCALALSASWGRAAAARGQSRAAGCQRQRRRCRLRHRLAQTAAASSPVTSGQCLFLAPVRGIYL